MNMQRLAATAAVSVAVLIPVAAVTPANAAAPKVYANCTALNAVYHHGVGYSTKTRDHVSGSTKPVTNFYVNAALYTANKKSDRDKDGIACEKL